MLQITNPLAKGSNKATLSCGWQVAAVFFLVEKNGILDRRQSAFGR